MPKNMQKKKKCRMSLCNLHIDVQPQKMRVVIRIFYMQRRILTQNEVRNIR